MQPNPDVSYFVTIKTDPATAAAIRSSTFPCDDGSPFQMFQAGYEDGTLRFELKWGAMAQDDRIEEAFLDLSRQFPQCQFTLERTCEEPYVPARTAVFWNGCALYDRYGRVLAPEAILDPVTVGYLAEALCRKGFQGAASFIKSLPTGGRPPAHAMLPSREKVQELRAMYPAGCRVELVRMDDVQAPPIGTKGTVTKVDDAGSICVDWDNGSRLHAAFGADVVKKIQGPPDGETAQ